MTDNTPLVERAFREGHKEGFANADRSSSSEQYLEDEAWRTSDACASLPATSTSGADGIVLRVGPLLERMAEQIEEWDGAEPRDDWWGYQCDYLEAHSYLTVVNESGPLVVAAPPTSDSDEMHSASDRCPCGGYWSRHAICQSCGGDA